MLASRLGTFEGLSVADLFAGSGALGLEALSRGAAHCLFVEQESDPLKAIRANVAVLGALGRARVQAGSVLTLGAARERSEEHTSELQSLMRISYAVLCLQKKI